MKMLAKNQKVSLHQMGTNDAFEKCVQPFDQPFPKILDSIGNDLHLTHCNLGKDDQPRGNDPAGDHRIRNRQTKWLGELHRFLRRPCSSGAGVAGAAVV